MKPQRKTVVIQQLVAAQAPFSFTFDNIYFEPDEVILRGISVSDINGVDANVSIWSDLVDNYPMVSFAISATPTNGTPNFNTCELHFPLNKVIKGAYTFTLKNFAGALADFDGVLGLHLEFVKY